MKAYQIQIQRFDAPNAPWETIAETNNREHAERLAESLRPQGHVSRAFSWENFVTIVEFDVMGIPHFAEHALA